MTHTDACCCVWCERVKTNAVDVAAWKDAHVWHFGWKPHPFPHERGGWHWLLCECGARVLIGNHPLQQTVKAKRKKKADG